MIQTNVQGEAASSRLTDVVSDARVRAVFDHSPMALTLFDLAAGRFAEVNLAALAMFGYSREEMLALTPGALGGWDDPARVAEARALLAQEGRAIHWEATLRRKSGLPFPAVLHFTDLDVDGARYRLAAIEDVTAQREVEERAVQAQKLQVVGQLAGGVAHDFNNVLTVITSTAELALADLPPGHPAAAALSTIQRASTRAADLTSRLLAVARRRILRPAAQDLNAVVRDLQPMLRRLARTEVDIDVRLTPAPAVVLADRASLDQVLLNLTLNALDAMPSGGTLTVAVDVATLSEADHRGTTLAPGPYAALRVQDTGAGMTADVQRRVFEPFFTTKPIGSGAGLGLAVVHGVVLQSHGDVTVVSQPGAGTSVAVWLPLAAPHQSAITAPTDDRPPRA